MDIGFNVVEAFDDPYHEHMAYLVKTEERVHIPVFGFDGEIVTRHFIFVKSKGFDPMVKWNVYASDENWRFLSFKDLNDYRFEDFGLPCDNIEEEANRFFKEQF